MGLASMASPTAAAPFAYVANTSFMGLSGTVSVIDTATNLVVGSPIRVGANPQSLAVTPDGKHVYVASFGNALGFLGSVSVIDTATNMVVATVPGVTGATEVAITPDGKHAYAG
jgi:YVTN family beta-propeller protein